MASNHIFKVSLASDPLPILGNVINHGNKVSGGNNILKINQRQDEQKGERPIKTGIIICVSKRSRTKVLLSKSSIETGGSNDFRESFAFGPDRATAGILVWAPVINGTKRG